MKQAEIMTLRADLTALLADVGIDGVDIGEAVEGEHVRSSAYHRIIAQTTVSKCSGNGHLLVATILCDPSEGVSKVAVVELVDGSAIKMDDPADFQQRAAGLMSKMVLLEAEGNRRFVRQRIRDWAIYLAVNAG